MSKPNVNILKCVKLDLILLCLVSNLQETNTKIFSSESIRYVQWFKRLKQFKLLKFIIILIRVVSNVSFNVNSENFVVRTCLPSFQGATILTPKNSVRILHFSDVAM